MAVGAVASRLPGDLVGTPDAHTGEPADSARSGTLSGEGHRALEAMLLPVRRTRRSCWRSHRARSRWDARPRRSQNLETRVGLRTALHHPTMWSVRGHAGARYAGSYASGSSRNEGVPTADRLNLLAGRQCRAAAASGRPPRSTAHFRAQVRIPRQGTTTWEWVRPGATGSGAVNSADRDRVCHTHLRAVSGEKARLGDVCRTANRAGRAKASRLPGDRRSSACL
jgi:hypothetical protein